jgi:LacI family transcriptional regulator
MSTAVNISDVAARAGVAVKTVSRVLNGHPYVSAETRERVEEAMRALDFRPSIAARILSGAKSNQIALIYDNHSPYYMFQIQHGCWNIARPMTSACWPSRSMSPIRTVGEQVRGLVTETHVDGIVLSPRSPIAIAVLRVLEAMNIPFVRISPGTNHALTSSVYMDDAQAADDMTTHLINFGHRRIGFIKGHPNHMASDERLFGYRRALDRAGIAYEPQLVARASSISTAACAPAAAADGLPDRRPRSSPRTTTWRQACWRWRTIAGSIFRATFRWPGSTTPPWPARSGRRSPRSTSRCSIWRARPPKSSSPGAISTIAACPIPWSSAPRSPLPRGNLHEPALPLPPATRSLVPADSRHFADRLGHVAAGRRRAFRCRCGAAGPRGARCRDHLARYRRHLWL